MDGWTFGQMEGINLAGKAVVQSTLDVFPLGALEVFFLNIPGIRGRNLQGTIILRDIQISGSIFLTLTPRQEGDAKSNFFRSVFGGEGEFS